MTRLRSGLLELSDSMKSKCPWNMVAKHFGQMLWLIRRPRPPRPRPHQAQTILNSDADELAGFILPGRRGGASFCLSVENRAIWASTLSLIQSRELAACQLSRELLPITASSPVTLGAGRVD